MKSHERTVTGASLVEACAMAFKAVSVKTYNLKIGFATINDFNHVSSKWLKEALENPTISRIKVSIFPAAQFGTIGTSSGGSSSSAPRRCSPPHPASSSVSTQPSRRPKRR